LNEADTPRQLLTAVLAVGPERRAIRENISVAAIAMPEIAAPTTAETIVEVLEHHVRTHGERPHLRIWHGEGDEICLTYADLRAAACRIASGLLERQPTRNIGPAQGTHPASAIGATDPIR